MSYLPARSKGANSTEPEASPLTVSRDWHWVPRVEAQQAPEVKQLSLVIGSHLGSWDTNHSPDGMLGLSRSSLPCNRKVTGAYGEAHQPASCQRMRLWAAGTHPAAAPPTL